MPSNRPAWSSAAATWVSAWVSTPRVTSAAGSGRVGRATVVLLASGVGGTHQPDDGQHCDEACGPGSYQVTSSDRWCRGHPPRTADRSDARHKAGGSTSQAGGAGASTIILAVDPGLDRQAGHAQGAAHAANLAGISACCRTAAPNR